MRRDKSSIEELHPAIARIFPEEQIKERLTIKKRLDRVPTLLKVAIVALAVLLTAAAKPAVTKHQNTVATQPEN